MVFPNTDRAGKSTLALRLVSCGARLFADDVLPLTKESNFGMALGILSRLRMPLPEGSDNGSKDFISDCAGPQNTRYLYVSLGSEEQARLGTMSSIRGITVLKREKNVQPNLLEGKKSNVVRDMILRNFARQNPSLEIVDRLNSITENAACYELRYDNLEAAVKLLEDIFGKRAAKG